MAKNVTTSIQMPAHLHEYFKSEAERRMTSAGAVMREILSEHVDRQPSVVFKRNRSGRGGTTQTEEVADA